MSKKMVTLNELLEIKDFAERVTLVNSEIQKIFFLRISGSPMRSACRCGADGGRPQTPYSNVKQQKRIGIIHSTDRPLSFPLFFF